MLTSQGLKTVNCKLKRGNPNVQGDHSHFSGSTNLTLTEFEIGNSKLEIAYLIPNAAIALCLYARPKGQMIPLISIPSLEMEVMCLTATMNER